VVRQDADLRDEPEAVGDGPVRRGAPAADRRKDDRRRDVERPAPAEDEPFRVRRERSDGSAGRAESRRPAEPSAAWEPEEAGAPLEARPEPSAEVRAQRARSGPVWKREDAAR